MNTIKFNNTEFQIESYNRTTAFTGESITSTAYCTLITNDVTSLNTLAQSDITTIQIYHDETLIYNLTNVHGHLDSTNEYLNGDRISVSVNLSFANE